MNGFAPATAALAGPLPARLAALREAGFTQAVLSASDLAAHPGGAISGGPGYIAAGLIARDLGLKLWWQPWDARSALQALPRAA